MVIRCSPYNAYGGRNKRNFDANELDLISAMRKQSQRMLRAANKTPQAQSRQVSENAARQAAQNKWIDQTGNVIRIFPEQGKRIEDFLVSMFGQKARFLGLDPGRNYTIAGEVRYNLETFQSVAEGMVNVAGRMQSVQRLREFTDTLKKVTDGKGTMTDEQLSKLGQMALEEGRIPMTLSNATAYRVNILGNQTTPVAQYLNRKYQHFLDFAQTLGLNKQEIDELVNAATEVSTVFDETRTIARAIGVEIPDQRNIGYFARIITDDFKNRLRDLDIPELFEQIRADVVDLSTVFGRSRKTVHYIPYDEVLAAQLLDIDVPTLRIMLDNPTEFRRYLHDNLTSDQLDTLVDSGIFEKLPMTSREVYEYFTQQYELPYRSLSQMFITDPVEVVQKYTASLQQAAGNSAMIRGIMDGRSFAAGWTVDEATVRIEPSRYSDFVPLGDYLDRWAAQANISPQQAIIRLGVAGSEAEAAATLKTFATTYVHPVVAAQWSAVMSVSANPALMSQFAHNLYRVGRILNKTLIGSNPLGYILNNAMGSMIQTVAGGGNILRYMPNYYQVLKAMQEGLDVFDNSRVYFTDRYGRSYTRRDIVERFLVTRGQSFAPGSVKIPYTVSSGANSFVKSVFETPHAFATAVNEIITYTMAKGNPVNGKRIPAWERPGRFTKASLSKIGEGLDKYFGCIAFVANLFEITGKLTVLDTILEKADGFSEAASTLGQLMSSFQFRRFDDLDEAFRHLDEYFVNPYSIGTVTARLGYFVFPFAAWRMSNPPMQIRHMLRNPQWFLSYSRLHALNQDNMSQDERAIEAAIEPWLLDSMPWYIGKDREGRPMLMTSTTYDPIADALVFFNDTGDKVNRMLGLKARRTADQRADARNETAQDFINDFINGTFLPIRGTYEVLAGIDTFTGRKIDDNPAEGYPDILGMNLPPRLTLLLSRVPFISKLDAINPGGIFGRSATTDTLTGQTTSPAIPSIFGGTRIKRDTRARTFENSPLWAQTLALAGFNIRSVDYDSNLQNTYGDVESTIKYLENSINSNRTEITAAVSNGRLTRVEYERRAQVVRDQTSLWGQLLIDKMRLDSYMRGYGVTPKAILRELDKKQLQIRDLPLPGDEQLEDIAVKVITIDRELDRLEGQVK